MIAYGRERFSGRELMDVSLGQGCLGEEKNVRIDKVSDVSHSVCKIHPGHHSTG